MTGVQSRAETLSRIHAHLAAPSPHGATASEDPISLARAKVHIYAMGNVGPGMEKCKFVLTECSGRPAEWIVPPNPDPERRILHLHGGGWIAGSISSHRALCAELALHSGQAVLLPDYRLAPEHPFPAGLDDAAAALAWVRTHAPTGISPARVITLTGDSAGGNLAAAVTLRNTCSVTPNADRIILFSPFLSSDLDVAAKLAAPILDNAVNQETAAAVAEAYLPVGGNKADPLVSPLLASDELLAQFPPILIQVSAAENLRDQALSFADRLWSVGVNARLSVWPDMPHVWHAFMQDLPEARAAIEEAARFAADEVFP